MSNKVVFLCNPPTPPEALADREGAYGMGLWLEATSEPRAPHTLAWCAALLKEAGWRTSGLDAVAERLDPSATVARLAAKRPTILVLLSSPTTAQSDLEFLRLVRKRLPATRLLLVGQATRFLPHSLVQEADMVLVGEPEGAIAAACQTLLAEPGHIGECAAQTLRPAAYNDRGQLLDLTLLPYPAWEHFPINRYHALPIVAGRGCSYGCRYCAAPIAQGRAARKRRTLQVAGEMEMLHSHFGATHFHFWDPLFAAERAQADELCETLARREMPKRVTWSCETRPEQLDLSLLQRMKNAGCSEIHLGLESVAPDTLMAIGRLPDAQAVQAYLTRVREIVLGCRAFEINCHLYVISGMPGNRDAAAITRTFLRAYSSQTVHVSPLLPHPGTSIFPTNQRDEETTLLGEMARPENIAHTEPFRLRNMLNRRKRAFSF